MSQRVSLAFTLLAAVSTATVAKVQSAPPIPVVAQASIVSTGTGLPKGVFNRDGDYSVGIDGKESLFMFRDTFMTGPNEAGRWVLHNSLSATASLNDASNGITLEMNYVDGAGAPTRFIPLTAAEQAYNNKYWPKSDTNDWPYNRGISMWPGQPVYDSNTDILIVPFSELNFTPKGYTGLGSGFAVGTINKKGWPVLQRPVQSINPATPDNPGAPTLIWGQGQRAYGTTDSLIYDGYFYAYGGSPESGALIGRVPLAGLLDTTQWTYWNGTGWDSAEADAVPVMDGGNDGQSVFWDAYLNEWVEVFLDTGGYLKYSVASALTGPWAPSTKVPNIPQPLLGVGGALDYEGHAHPEFSPDNGKTEYVTVEELLGGFGPGKTAMPVIQIVFQ